jgi:hypothetical protein
MNEKLPIVQPDIKLSTTSGDELQDFDDFMSETLQRMKIEQPELTSSMDEYIQGTAIDSADALKMTEVMVMTYRMLEAQAEADAQKESQEQL